MALSFWLKSLFFMSYFMLLLTICTRGEAFECTNDVALTYLDGAMDMLKKAKDFYPPVRALQKAEDCGVLLDLGYDESGIYTIWPRNRVMEGRSLQVYCDMQTDGGGWTLIQRRGNFTRAIDYFYKDWQEYKEGFGNLAEDFWLGNDNIFAISNQKQYFARFDLKDVTGARKYALYDTFWIDDENHKYMLHIKNYKGNAGDSMNPRHNNQKFSTKDNQNDNRSGGTPCAVIYKGGWWYADCHDSNLNGLNHQGKHEGDGKGINWKSWKGHHESLAETEIKLRPKNFKKPESGMTPQR